MHIPITFNPSSSTEQNTKPKLPSALAKISSDEVVLIELQGSLEVEGGGDDGNGKNGKFVGKLSIDESGSGKSTLLIGHHVLEGKIAQLVKPLAVLNRSIPDASPTISSSLKGRGEDDDEAMNVDDESHTHTSMSTRTPSQTHWEAVAIVKRKIVFSKRPMLLVGHSTSSII